MASGLIFILALLAAFWLFVGILYLVNRVAKCCRKEEVTGDNEESPLFSINFPQENGV
jgi:hypothetical protein